MRHFQILRQAGRHNPEIGCVIAETMLRTAKGKRVRWVGKPSAIEAAMDWKSTITADPAIMHGAVCFRGTRIPVSIVLDNLAAGETAASILSEYPTLKAEHIPAAIGYAADLVRERIVAVPV